jgi:hypothetical protein
MTPLGTSAMRLALDSCMGYPCAHRPMRSRLLTELRQGPGLCRDLPTRLIVHGFVRRVSGSPIADDCQARNSNLIGESTPNKPRINYHSALLH